MSSSVYGATLPVYVTSLASTKYFYHLVPFFLLAACYAGNDSGVSHLAAALGIPAVVCPNATRLLHTGDRIRVDGNTGRIDVLQRAERQAANA